MSDQHLKLHSSGHLTLHSSGHLKLYSKLTYTPTSTSLGQEWHGSYSEDKSWSRYTYAEIEAFYPLAISDFSYVSMLASGTPAAIGGYAGQTSYANAIYEARYCVKELIPSSGTTLQNPIAASLVITAASYSNYAFGTTSPSLCGFYVGTSDTAPTGDPRNLSGNLYSGTGSGTTTLTDVALKKYVYWGCYAPSTTPTYSGSSGGHAISVGLTFGAVADAD